jgi:hypothetical protein
MTFLLRWGIEPLNGRPFTGPSTPAQTTRNTSTTPQVIHHPILINVDIWKFTIFWTFTIFGVVFLAAGLWAWSVYFFKTKWAVLIPVIYLVSGEFIALISGTIVGTSISEVTDGWLHTCGGV